jgi:DNA-binding MarR family transcriptional regulator
VSSKRKGKFIGCEEEKILLDMFRTTEVLSRPVAELLKTEELSGTQYNVLRILRGASEGLSCGEIGNRMITHDPDITRLLDRLEKRGLILRTRDNKDRRLVLTDITQEGLDVLARLDQPIQDLHRRQLGHLGRERLKILGDLLRTCRRETV